MSDQASTGYEVALMRGQEKLRAALATSQADVTRLAAELAEAEKCAATWWDNWHATRAELAESVRALAVSQGEAAKLREAAWSGRYLVRRLFATTRHFSECVCVTCEDARAFLALAPPTPTASPEPDRASPEVTAKENDDGR